MKLRNAYLGTSTFTNSDDAVLLWVEAHAYLAHGLGIGNRDREVSIQVKAAKQPLPLVVPSGCIRQTLGD